MIPRRRGTIVNLSSVSGREGHAYDSAYCASKFAVLGLTESLAEEVMQYNIRVCAVLPDAVKTPLWNQNGPVAPPASALCPERVAEFIVYLLGMPEDTILVHPVIAAFRPRRRKGAR
jgi:short-subunit dehydrogenase